jgi:hypothetical protein
MKILIAFAIGFIVATVGVGNFANFLDRQADKAKVVIHENVK